MTLWEGQAPSQASMASHATIQPSIQHTVLKPDFQKTNSCMHSYTSVKITHKLSRTYLSKRAQSKHFSITFGSRPIMWPQLFRVW